MKKLKTNKQKNMNPKILKTTSNKQKMKNKILKNKITLE